MTARFQVAQVLDGFGHFGPPDTTVVDTEAEARAAADDLILRSQQVTVTVTRPDRPDMFVMRHWTSQEAGVWDEGGWRLWGPGGFIGPVSDPVLALDSVGVSGC